MTCTWHADEDMLEHLLDESGLRGGSGLGGTPATSVAHSPSKSNARAAFEEPQELTRACRHIKGEQPVSDLVLFAGSSI